MLSSRKTMGLAVSEQGISAAQIVLSAERRAVLRTAALSFSNELNLDEPQKLGKELRNVLHRGGLTASRCVIGLAAARIAAKEKVLPATDTDSLRGILSIASEQEFASGPQELSFDYFVWPSEKGIAALLAAAPRRLIEQLALMAKAAGLSVAAVTSSALATAQATTPTEGAPGRLILCLQPGGVEVIVQSAQRVRLIRHLSARLD